MSDPAGRFPESERTRLQAARELTARHYAAVLAYAHLLCRDQHIARELAGEAFAETLEAAFSGMGPTHAWRPHLLAATRRTAALWADTDRRTALSPGFLDWLQSLPLPDPASPCASITNAAAEENSFTLQAFWRLPGAWQAGLWQSLEQPADPEERAPSPDLPTALLPPIHLVQGFYDAYLQRYAARTPRDCRMLTARLGDSVRRGTLQDRELELHLTRCPGCSHARTELIAIHTWQRPSLLEALLLWTGNPSPATADITILPSRGQAQLPCVQAPQPRQMTHPIGAGDRKPVPSGKRTIRRPAPSNKTIAIGLTVLGLSVLAAAAAAVTANRPAPPAAAPQPPPPPSPSPTTAQVTAPATSPATAPATSPAAAPLGIPAVAPGRSETATANIPSASPSSQPAGFRLVNAVTGLCVGPDDDNVGIRLQTCTRTGLQTWQLLRTDTDGLYQLRHTATGQCLDGTTTGGNTVPVTLQPCRPAAEHREQLWKPGPDKVPAAFRLYFAPPVASSDYGTHLLGPTDVWPGPPRNGSPLVHQPNYYNKDYFLFTTG
ncbi:hypothetical protein F7Q99_28920 [Streptomyces kaniharaensis]|uniref:Ricin B lectin domain-containing protein n=1 Tax=Streptomyces kaniharaensis TaxID=212423 RepID=A0A6N7L1S8_9ACTN|nr:RICIN domain-containing protein [Streptomyces kaniharaensis]MQS16144.1 hypothetical protein [Streptomyces kaniharaensis]